MDLFHVSRQDLGQEVTLTPRAGWQGKAIGEDTKTPRVSVAADIEHCLLGITWVKAPKTAWVYKLKGRPRGIDFDSPQLKVPDWETTEEIWLLEPNKFRLVGTISIDTAAWMDRGTPVWKWDKKVTQNGGAMSRKDYVLIAKVLAKVRGDATRNKASVSAFYALNQVADEMADALQSDNASFKRMTFLKAARRFE